MWDNDPSNVYCGHVPVGCGVAIAGNDWPQSGAGAFNLTAMMQNAQNVLGANSLPLWRYDWNAVQSVANGSWTYVATDWCVDTNKSSVNADKHRGQHPAPNGTIPGMLGWNEPNVPGQCEAAPLGNETESVAEYVALAKEFKKHGKFVVTPAPGGGSPWLDNFLGACLKLGFKEIDYMAYHNYVACDSGKIGNRPFTTPEMMYGELNKELTEHIAVMDKYNSKGFKIKGIWLTEVACAPDGGWGVSGTWRMDAPEILMTQLFQLAKNTPQLLAWSWFPYVQFGMLWDSTNYTITPLGEFYFSNCGQDRLGQPIVV